MSNESSTSVHPFEAAGLGKAPFRFVGMVKQDLAYGQAILNRDEYQRTGIMLSTKPGGSCDYCGTYIVNMYRVRSADGREFKVGCDCIEKTGDRSLKAGVSKAKRLANLAQSKAKAHAVEVKLARLLARLENRRALRALPGRFPGRGSALENVRWMLRNAGAAGKARTLKQIRALLGA